MAGGHCQHILAIQEQGLYSNFKMCRLTAVTTPAVSRILGLEVAKREWIACGAALLGGLFITLDTALADNTAATDAALGLPLPFITPTPHTDGCMR